MLPSVSCHPEGRRIPRKDLARDICAILHYVQKRRSLAEGKINVTRHFYIIDKIKARAYKLSLLS